MDKKLAIPVMAAVFALQFGYWAASQLDYRTRIIRHIEAGK